MKLLILNHKLTKNTRLDIIPYFNYNGKNVYYELNDTEIKEKAIIFIHGSGGSTYTWKDQLANLNLNYSVIAIDLPSHSKTEEFSNLSLDLYVDVLKGLVENLNLNEIILTGHSLGGAVTMDFYFKYPKKISALILIGTGARLRVSQNIFNLLQHNFQLFLDQYPSVFDRKTSKDIYKPVIDRVAETNPDVTLTDYNICDKFDIMDQVSEITLPVLLICGSEDQMTPVKYTNFLAERITSSVPVIIDGGTHWVYLEKPEAVNKAIDDFLSRLN